MKFKMIIIVRNANVGEIELAQNLTDYEIAQIGSKYVAQAIARYNTQDVCWDTYAELN